MAVIPLEEPRSRLDNPASVRVSSTLATKPPWRPSRNLRLTVVAFLALAAGGGLLGWRMVLRPIAVEAAGVSTNVPLQVYGLGTVGARVQSSVGFKVAGVLVDLKADQGDHVRAGAVLARLDARDVEAQFAAAKAGVAQADANIVKAQAAVEIAQANLTNAASVNTRRSDLARSGFASKEEAQTTDAALRVARANLDVAGSEVSVAKAALEVAAAQQAFEQATLDNYTLRAPYDALVVARALNLGSMPVPGQTVFNLVDPGTIWVLGYVDERLAGRLQLGQKAEIVLRSLPSERLPGHVARIEIQSDAVNEERLVEVAFDSIPADIHLAEQAEIFIATGDLKRAVLVPPAAVRSAADGQGTIWTVEEGKLAERRVSFGPELLNGSLPIIAGLPDAAQVVVTPQTGLRIGRAAHVEGTAR